MGGAGWAPGAGRAIASVALKPGPMDPATGKEASVDPPRPVWPSQQKLLNHIRLPW